MNHVRIDEGISRSYPQRENANERNAKGQYLPLLPSSPDAISKALADYAAGATLEQIAETHQVSKQALYSWLLGDIGGKEHADLVTRALTSRIAEADENLDNSANPLDLSRAREQARFRRMDFERRRAHLYGQQQASINVNASGPVSIQVVEYVVAPAQSQRSMVELPLSDVSQTVDDNGKSA